MGKFRVYQMENIVVFVFLNRADREKAMANMKMQQLMKKMKPTRIDSIIEPRNLTIGG